MAEGDYSIGSEKLPGLSKMIEETGELNRILGKLIATNGELIHFSGEDLRAALEEEIADTLAAIEFFIEENSDIVKRKAIEARKDRKLDLFLRWHDQQRAG